MSEMELTPEQKAEAAIKELQAARAAKIKEVSEQISKLLQDNDLDIIVQHNIQVIPRQK